MELFKRGKQCWYGDVHRALLQLPYPIDLGPSPIEDAGDVDDIRELIKGSMRRYLRAQSAINPKLVLLQCRPSEKCVKTGSYGAAPVMEFRGYLKLAIPEHRTALTRVLLSTHELAIERLRWQGVARPDRLCRLCGTAVEHPVHALFQCTGAQEVVDLRLEFLGLAGSTDRALAEFVQGRSDLERLRVLAVHEPTLPMFAKYVYRVLKVYATVPMVQ
ncbi:hypothetical protein AURDEDRAFT_62347 [Auricularia subglabra TFB-10046 SS5]|nr:hypothetical protein AURDEDRAFT_62347 [Auricularia subglabra TFB-10046 SS5]